MKTAISLFRAGEIVDADGTSYTEVDSLRLACPECLEPVILVDRTNARYFAHYPQKPGSPPCPLRVESSGESIDSTCRKRVNRIFKQDVFQEVFSIICGVASLPPLVSPYKQAIDKLIRLMQQVWLRKRRCILISDLPIPPQDYLRKWTTTGKLVQTYISIYSTDIPHWISTYESLKSEEHVITVLLLWKHLHLEQVKKDLRFLLQLSHYVSKDRDNVPSIGREHVSDEANSAVLGYLIFQALSLLTVVPWLEVPSLLEKAADVECASCKKRYSQTQQLEATRCNECSKPLCPYCRDRCAKCNIDLCKEHADRHRNYSCPDCGQGICETFRYGYPQHCIGCGEEVCAECYHFCACCHEPVCDDCYHGEYVCESCGDDFCENHPEGIQRVECLSCSNIFCDTCADESIFKCPECGEMICEKCCEECSDCDTEFCEDCFAGHDCSE